MQRNRVENLGTSQNSHQNVTQSTRVPLGKKIALVLAGLVCAVLPKAAFAQTTAAPQVLPYYHTIPAGSGTQLPLTQQTYVVGQGQVHGAFPGDGGPAEPAQPTTPPQLYGPVALAVDSIGNLYIVDSDLITGGSGTKGSAIRRIDTTGKITTFAGGLAQGVASSKNYLCTGGLDIYGDGCPANETFLNQAYGIAIDPKSGDIYFSEGSGARIRKIDHSSYVTSLIVSGSSKTVTLVDGAICTSATCTASVGNVAGPRAIAFDRHGNLYIADSATYAVRMINFSTQQLKTVVNTAWTKGAQNTTCTTGPTTAGAAVTGSIQGLAFDNAGNLYFGDATCDYVYKVAENPATGIVDANSQLSVVVGTGASATGTNSCGITNFNQYFKGTGARDGSAACLSPSSVLADPSGNLFIGESTSQRVWFWDAATGYAHTVLGGGTAGCYGTGSGTSPYNGCDGPDSAFNNSALTTQKGFPGLAMDPWGNLYVGDPGNFYVHEIALGTNAPAPTTPSGYANVLLHFGANDNFSAINSTAAPDFNVTQGLCSPANADGTVDCGLFVAAAGSSVFENALLTSATGLKKTIDLTNQASPTCQPPTVQDQTVRFNGATSLTLNSRPGPACAGYETVVASPHNYTYTVITQPANGTLSGTAPNLTYTPNPGYNGLDSITYTVTDNSTFASNQVPYDGGTQTVSLETVSPTASASATVTLQGPPIAIPQTVVASVGVPVTITLAGTDANGSSLTYTIVSQPTQGTLGPLSGNSVTYTTGSSLSGNDSFTFTVSDGALTSAPATVTISGHPGVPIAQNQSVSLSGPGPVSITLASTGAAIGSVTYAVVTQPVYGVLGGTAPNLTYTPTSTPILDDSFSFSATTTDGSSIGTISFKAPLLPPVAQNQSVTAVIGTPTSIALSATGTGTIVYSLVASPKNGKAILAGSIATYTPNSGYIGPDSFTFKANNGVDSNVATVNITVNPLPPVTQNLSTTTSFNTSTAVILSANGTGPLAFQIVTSPTNGTLSGTAPNLTYTPNAGFAGSDSFTYTATNAGGTSNIATVTLSVSQGLVWTATSGSSLSATVKAGSTATYGLQISAWKGANAAVNFICSGAAVACTVSPSTVTLNGTTPVPVMVSVATTTMPPSTAGVGAGKPGWWLLLSLGGGLLLLPLRKRRSLLLCVVCLLAIAGAVGCTGVPEHPFGTATGNYSLNVQAYSNGTPVGQPVAITLNVQ
jgi:hypothetical protein